MSADRRTSPRVATRFPVDVRSRDHFLFAYVANISELGIFIRTDEPLLVGEEVDLVLRPDDSRGQPASGTVFTDDANGLVVHGVVTWVNPVVDLEDLNPGMGVRFEGLTPALRERLVDLIRTIAYL